MSRLPRAGRKQHIGRDAAKTFCGNPILQQTKNGPALLVVGPPRFCNCRPCLTKYYTDNPLQTKRTKVYGVRKVGGSVVVARDYLISGERIEAHKSYTFEYQEQGGPLYRFVNVRPEIDEQAGSVTFRMECNA